MIQKIIHTYLTRLLATALVFAGVVLTTKYLGADGKGITSIFTTNILFINLISEMVGGVSIIYLSPRMQLVNILLPSVIFTLLNSVVMTMLFFFTGIADAELAIHLCLVAVLQSLLNIILYVALGKQQINTYNYLFLLKALVNTLMLAVFFVMLEMRTVMTFIYALYIANILPLIFGGFWLLKKFSLKGISGFREATKKLVSYSIIAQLANIVQTLNYRLSFYLLAFFIDDGAVGIYSVALALSDVVWLLTKSIGTVQLTKISNTESDEDARTLTKKYLGYGILCTLALLLPMLIVPENFYLFVFGKDFSGIKNVMLALGLGILIFSVNIILSNYFAGKGQYAVNLKASLLGLAIAGVANFFLIQNFGLIGAAIAASITYISITVFTSVKYIIVSKPI